MRFSSFTLRFVFVLFRSSALLPLLGQTALVRLSAILLNHLQGFVACDGLDITIGSTGFREFDGGGESPAVHGEFNASIILRTVGIHSCNELYVAHWYFYSTSAHDTSTRQYARLVRQWVKSIGLEPSSYGTNSMRRTKVAQIYQKTGNLRAVQLLLGHIKMDSTVRYLGVDLEDALTISEAVEI